MRRVRVAVLPLLALVALLPAVDAAALRPTPKLQRKLAASPFLWATVNFCDSKRHPNAMGVRVSMPGTFANSPATMYTRIRAQYFRTVKPRGWRNVTLRGSDSGWFPLGNARRQSRQGGYTFHYNPQGFRFRAVASFQWRVGPRVFYAAREVTSAGHRHAAHADPRGHSTVTCVIRKRKPAIGKKRRGAGRS